MSAVEEAVQVLEDHVFNKALAQCSCGANLADTGHRTRAHRKHLAEALEAAGLLLTAPASSGIDWTDWIEVPS